MAGHPVVTLLSKIAKQIDKATAEKRHGPVFEAFVVAALAGDTKRTRALLDVLTSGLPPAKRVVSALSTHAIDVYCAAAGFGDRTKGEPTHDYELVKEGTLAQRVEAIERGVRERVTANAYAGDYPKDDAWRKKPAGDPWRLNDRWRRVQWLCKPANATKANELDALERLREILGEWTPESRGAGYGSELVLALDLALRHGAKDDARHWVEAHGARLRDSLLAQTAMCFPAVAKEMVAGGLRLVIGLADKELAAAFAPIEKALGSGAPAAKSATAKVPAVQKRIVTCEYSQVHLEHVELTQEEREQVYFQVDGHSERGMSLFPTKAGIATPTETEEVRACIRVEPGRRSSKADLEGAVQAVAFPLSVRGPLVLRSVASDEDEDEPFIVPPGDYDVLAVFTNEKKVRGAPLRRFDLSISFRASGALSAPRTIKVEDS